MRLPIALAYDAIRKALVKWVWHSKEYYLCYDWKAMAKHYWLRCRGLANSGTLEKMYLCWRGQCPHGVPTERKHVDPGSKMYVETVAKVPILAPKDHYYVSQAVRDKSLASKMGAAPAAPAAPPTEGLDAAASAAVDEPEGPPTTRLAAPGSNAAVVLAMGDDATSGLDAAQHPIARRGRPVEDPFHFVTAALVHKLPEKRLGLVVREPRDEVARGRLPVETAAFDP